MQTPEKEMNWMAEKLSKELFKANQSGFNSFFKDLMIQLHFSHLHNISQMSEKEVMEYWMETKKVDFDIYKKGKK